MINKAILIGHLGKDPEIRTAGDAKVANFSLATSESYKDRNGDWKEKTEWHNIVMWRYLAERAEKYLKKGMEIYVEGKIETRSWEDNEGTKKYITEIVCSKLTILSRIEKSSENTHQDNSNNDNSGSDDLPF